MENNVLNQSNYTTDCNTFQLSLPLNLEILIDPNDEVFSFLEAIEGVNLFKYLKRKHRKGRKGHENVLMLRAEIFARMIGYSSLRQYARLARNDIRFMLILGEVRPSHQSFWRLENLYLIDSIDDIYFEITSNICKLMDVDTSIQYIDGTKIEANANKYSFVYKTRIINARLKLFEKITETIIRLNCETGFDFPYRWYYCSQEIGYIAQYLMELMVNENIEIVYGKGKRKSTIQRYYDQILEYFVKLDEYEYWLLVIGEDRNSCSKTDHDATMCATKMDYYCNTGLSRPCYNAQIAVSDGIIVNADLFQRPADSKTFMPFMERFHDHAGAYPAHPVADAGYGSYDNYMYCLSHGMELDMKYPLYAKKNEARYRKRIDSTINWETDGKGNKVCPFGHVFDQFKSDCTDSSGEYPRITQYYESNESCEGCPHRGRCYKGKGDRRVISRNVVLQEFYATVDANLSTSQGKEMKKQRSIQVEGAFGVIKQDMKFTRFERRGMKKVKMEFLLVCLGYNLKKYHMFRMRKIKASKKINLN